MNERRAWLAVAVATLAGALLVAVALAHLGVVAAPWSEDRATVTVVGADGTERATVDAAVADAWAQRHTGLAEYDSLEDGEGMLFVHAYERERTYVMRGMDFDLDLIFVGADGTITTIHHASAPADGEDGADRTYSGRAKWVLEVPAGYTTAAGVEVGDAVRIEFG